MRSLTAFRNLATHLACLARVKYPSHCIRPSNFLNSQHRSNLITFSHDMNKKSKIENIMVGKFMAIDSIIKHATIVTVWLESLHLCLEHINPRKPYHINNRNFAFQSSDK